MNYVAVVASPQGSFDPENDGTLYTWGDNTFGQLGLGTKEKSVAIASVVKIPNPVRQVSCSKGDKHNHTSCVDWAGKLYSWGDPYKGNVGI